MPPYRDLGIGALENASTDPVKLGNVGAGFGAKAGAYKGGLGSASLMTSDGIEVGAVVAVNSFGSPVVPGSNALWAAPYALSDEMGPDPMAGWPTAPIPEGWPDDTKVGALPGMNTTIGVVATNVALTPAEARRVAIMGQDGFARALRPIHTPMDGDTLFAISTAMMAMPDPAPLSLARIGSLAADCMTRAIGRAIWEAQTMGEMKAFREI